MAGAYGISRGLSEGYKAFRQRQGEIEAEADRAANRHRAGVMAEREDEAYEYDMSRRPARERAEELGIKRSETAAKMEEANYNEFVKNTALRAEQNRLQLQTVKQQLKASGLQIDDAEISLRAKQGAEKYNNWTQEWLQGGDMQSLVDKFNSDEDDTNNIRTVTGDEQRGWKVIMDNGRTMEFADRDQVAIHLQSMADPNFHQTYLLQKESDKAALAKALQSAGQKTADTMSKEKTTWENMTRNQVKDYFTESIKESIVSLGSEGARDIAGDVRAVVDKIGASSQYSMVNSDVTRIANSLAKRMLVKEPAERKRMAEEYLDQLRESGAAIPEKDDENYDAILNRQMAEDYDRAYEAYERAVYSKFFQINADGSVAARDYSRIVDAANRADPQRQEKGDTITTDGLERPGSEKTPVTDTPPPDGDSGIPPRPEKDVMPVDRETTGATISLTGESLVKKKKQEYGWPTGAAARRRPTRAIKERITRDFDLAFGEMTKDQQGAWFREFGKHIDERRQELALATMKGEKLASK